MISKKILMRFIKNGWWLLLLALVAAVGGALAVTAMTAPLYQSTTRYVISPSRTTLTDGGDMVYGIDALSRRSTVATYVEIFQSERAIDGAAEAVNLRPDMVNDYVISAVVLPETSVIHLAVTGPNQMVTQQLATAVGAEAVAYIRDLYDVYEINLLDAAKVPEIPVSPNIPRTTVLAAVLGLVVGFLLALLRTPEILGSPHPMPTTSTVPVDRSLTHLPGESHPHERFQPPRTPAKAGSAAAFPVARQKVSTVRRRTPEQFDLLDAAPEAEMFQLPGRSKGNQ